MIYYVSKQLTTEFNTFNHISITESLNLLDELDIISVDTETEGLDRFRHKILLLQLGNKDFQVVIDTSTINPSEYKNLLENKYLIFQNAKFDLQFLFKNNIIPLELWDTMLAEQVINNGISNISNLEYLVLSYCNVVLDKQERLNIVNRGITNNSIIYGANDIKYLEDIMNAQIKIAKEKGLYNAIILENLFVAPLAYTEFCGIYLNKEKWIAKYTSAKQELNILIKKLEKWVIDNNFDKYIDRQLNIFTEYKDGKPILTKTTINWASTKQVKPLFKDIGINVKSDDNVSGESIAEKVLVKQKDFYSIIPIYLQYQTIKKDFTTYGERFLNHINPITNRIHAEFNQLMNTARLSCNNPNLQNLPSDDRTRSCFIAENGNILIDGDYKAQEDILFVNNSMEDKMIEFYQLENADGHKHKLCPSLKKIGRTQGNSNHI